MRTTLAVVAAFLAGCASTNKPGAGVHLSSAEHEAIAVSEETQAQEHRARYDPRLTRVEEHCSPGGAWHRAAGDDAECWTDTVNPTSAELVEAKKHERTAATHRAASQALRDAEARACLGVSPYDRDVSPFSHRADIVRIEPLPRFSSPPPALPPKIAGAVIVFRPVPNLTADELQHIIDCHIARNDALGHSSPEMLYCPLVPRDVTAKVKKTSEGFEVEIRSTDAESAREVLHRAELLAP